jgi:hypothetical protein
MNEPRKLSHYETARRDLKRLQSDCGKAIFHYAKDPGGEESRALRAYAMRLDDYSADLSRAEREKLLLPPVPQPPRAIAEFVTVGAAPQTTGAMDAMTRAAGVDTSDLEDDDPGASHD